MFELDINSGIVTCGQYVVSRGLNHEAFMRRYSDFSVTEERHHTWGLEKIYGAPFQLTSSQTGFLSVTYFNEDISHIHIDAENIVAPDFKTEESEANWWDLQQRWLPIIRELMFSQLGKPDLIESSKLYDEASRVQPGMLGQLENWKYSFSWGKAGLAYVSEDWSYRIWIGYKLI